MNVVYYYVIPKLLNSITKMFNLGMKLCKCDLKPVAGPWLRIRIRVFRSDPNLYFEKIWTRSEYPDGIMPESNFSFKIY